MLSPRAPVALATALRATHFEARRSVATFTRSYPSFASSTSSSSRPAFFQQSFHPTAATLTVENSKDGSRRSALLVAGILAGLGVAVLPAFTDSLKLDAAPAPSSAGVGLTTLTLDPSRQVVVDTENSLSFPLYLPTPASFKTNSTNREEPRFRLVGLGVRTVSFLRVRVYVAALYIDEAALQARLSQSVSSNISGKTLEENMTEMLDEGTPAVIRIVPVRNTDFNHLRDGFIRALQGRLKKALKQGQIKSDSSSEFKFQNDILQIKESFPRGSVPKGSPLDLVILPSGGTKPVRTSLNFEYDGQIFGQVQAGSSAEAKAEKGEDAGFTVARELVLAYFADQGEISAPFKKSVEEGIYHQLPTPGAP